MDSNIPIESVNGAFTPPNWTIEKIRRVLPASVYRHRPALALTILARDIAIAALLFWVMATLDNILARGSLSVLRPVLWPIYWWFQGLTFTGLWVIGHECVHESFLPSKLACATIGLICHTFLWTPHLSWKATHRIHHRYHGHMVHDQHWIPALRSEVKVYRNSIWEYLQDAPLVVLAKLVVQQMVGFQSYLLLNITGPRHYPGWTNHFNPYSIMFRPQDRGAVVISDLALLVMVWITTKAVHIWGMRNVVMFYGIPYLLVSHWVTMIVYLQHTDPAVPHYWQGGWTYTRGALATVDRDFLGWQGRFFLHDIAHFHVVHHLFPHIPFHNGEVATQHVKKLLGKDYHASNEPVLKTLWRNINSCQFVEDEGDVVFYKGF
ncbi:fatty acid desaturase-domain-containing protein [Mycena vitilis]|nr:fatty acid desaturase-domain-containing protein [Mycena vitilis]